MSKKVILVVEDDDGIRNMLIDFFNDSYQMIGAEDGLKALNFVRNQHIDLIITDINMPNMSGTDFLLAIGQEGHSTPCIVVSGYIDDGMRELLKELNVSEIFEKPVVLNDIHKVVQKIINF